jgi:hypothetical protein
VAANEQRQTLTAATGVFLVLALPFRPCSPLFPNHEHAETHSCTAIGQSPFTPPPNPIHSHTHLHTHTHTQSTMFRQAACRLAAASRPCR